MPRQAVREIEKLYGKYLMLPLDLPKPNLGVQFRETYMKHARGVSKMKIDVAGGVSANQNFMSIDYHAGRPRPADSSIWTQNEVPGLLSTVMPELLPLLEALPFDSIPSFSMWSSNQRIIPHRDQGPWLDAPCSLRVMLYDENPTSTLMVQERTTRIESIGRPILLPRVPGTVAYGWNNLRTQHSSVRIGEMRKILLIVNGGHLNLMKFEDLIERSIAKYREHAAISKNQLSDFATI